MHKGLEYLVGRLSEASTWRGIVAIGTAFGITMTPEQAEAIVAGGLGLIGLIGAFLPDSK